MIWRCLATELDGPGKLPSEKMGACVNGVASLYSGLSPFTMVVLLIDLDVAPSSYFIE